MAYTKIERVTMRPGATSFHSSIATVEWVDEKGERHIDTGPRTNPLINSLCCHAEYLGVVAEYRP